MKKALTANKAWSLIAEMGWGGRTENYKHLAETYFKFLGKKGMQELYDFVTARVKELGEAVAMYDQLNVLTSLEVGSDDGFSDLRYHIVGLGKDEFDACMKDPRKMQIRYRKEEYKESFAYVFLEPDPPRTAAEKKSSRELLAKNVKALEVELRNLEFQLTVARGYFQDINMLLEQVLEDTKESA